MSASDALQKINEQTDVQRQIAWTRWLFDSSGDRDMKITVLLTLNPVVVDSLAGYVPAQGGANQTANDEGIRDPTNKNNNNYCNTLWRGCFEWF